MSERDEQVSEMSVANGARRSEASEANGASTSGDERSEAKRGDRVKRSETRH